MREIIHGGFKLYRGNQPLQEALADELFYQLGMMQRYGKILGTEPSTALGHYLGRDASGGKPCQHFFVGHGFISKFGGFMIGFLFHG